MKLIAVGDTHGRNIWKSIAENESFDKFVFVGDYFDSREGIISGDQLSNFKEILKFKKENPERVVLLFGNHDFHYLQENRDEYSLYNFVCQPEFNNILVDAIKNDLVQICYKHNKFLFSHAGISTEWCKTHNINYEEENFDQQINHLLKHRRSAFEFLPNMLMSNTGNDITQSPIWIRPIALAKSRVKPYIHVAGHTQVSEIMYMPNHYNQTGMILIDILGTENSYLIIENDKPRKGTYELQGTTQS